MTDAVERLRQGCPPAFAGASLVTEDMVKGAEEIERLRSLLAYALTKLEDVWDEGPDGEGWQSTELTSWLEDCRAALSRNQNGG